MSFGGFFFGPQFPLQFWDFSPTLKFETSKIYFEKKFFNEIFLLQKFFFFSKKLPKIFFQKKLIFQLSVTFRIFIR